MVEDSIDDAAFRFAYDGPTIRYGIDAVADLATELAALDAGAALLVCGQTVGTTDAVIEPVTTGLGNRCVGVLAETTPAKRLDTALDVRAAYEAHDADALVGLGGGSSLDVAKVARALIGDDRDRAAIQAEFQETGTVTVPDEGVPPLVVIPTTLAGADQSQVAGITAAHDEGIQRGGVSDPRLRADCVCYDPALVATTPVDVLCGSAMNGFDKGIETLYSRHATPITDATARDGLSYLDGALPTLRTEPLTATSVAPVVTGIALVQYGISRPDASTLSIIHAFGHALTAYGDLQQGVAHAVVAPHVLEYVLAEVPTARTQLAEAFDVTDADDPGQAVVDRVTAIRDGMELPRRLRATHAPAPDSFDRVADAVLDDAFMRNTPTGFDPSHADIVGILEAAR